MRFLHPFLTLGLVFADALFPSDRAAPETAGHVRVEIVENIPDEANWDFVPGSASETYSEPAFGFVAMPARYGATGVRADRSKPFLFRAAGDVALPQGRHRLLLRAHGGSRLFIDGKEFLATRFHDFKADGHEEVPELPKAVSPNIRYLRPGHFETLADFTADGAPHTFTLETLVGLKDRRPELGELSVSISLEGQERFRLLSPAAKSSVALTEEGFERYAADQRIRWKEIDSQNRRKIAAADERYWNWRHDLARKMIPLPESSATPITIDSFVEAKLLLAKVEPAPAVGDYAFARRVTLDTIGIPPSPAQVEAFANDSRPDKRDRLIQKLLSHPGWADHWVSYWQDVLAENPGILKPMLNNTGPFRTWIYESFADNKPMDRFATELILMDGSAYYGGPAGFGMATDNDVPMAQKAQIIGQAFLGLQMQCARCHDAPHHEFKQKDLFSLAALLKRGVQPVPWSSSIPTNSHITIDRKVKVTLPPGSKVEPAWPFPALVDETDLAEGVLRRPKDSREKFAALVTHPRNTRFAKVVVNRLWKRYLGWGLVEPVDDWETAQASHPELLDFLARELMAHDYDLKHVAALILNSKTYQRQPRQDGSEETLASARLFAAQARRRLSAEQLVDSLFSTVGKPFDSEELNMDVDGRRPVKDFNNLGIPTRSWQFASLSNERDRPALSLPRAQAIVDTLTTFGWRESRQNPVSVRDDSPNVVQPATLANGILGHGRIARLSDDNAITSLALEERSLTDFVQALYLRVLSRPPNAEETVLLTEYLRAGYEDRRNPEFTKASSRNSAPVRAVSWANHLNPEATRIKQEQERAARLGDLPTQRLRPAWRERAEDALWAMVNSPEFVFVP